MLDKCAKVKHYLGVMFGEQTMPGKLIVFEGVDGIGKSSLSKEVMRRLKDLNVASVSLAFPGNDPGTLGHLVYQIHHDAAALGVTSITALALQTLHVAAHLDAIEHRILPALQGGTWVILDRFWWSTWVYGIHQGIAPDYLEAIIEAERVRWGSVKPDLLLMVDRAEAIRAEHDAGSFTRLRTLYKTMAAREQKQYQIATVENDDFDRSAEMVWSQIRSLVSNEPTQRTENL
jgi:dTMP kinase